MRAQASEVSITSRFSSETSFEVINLSTRVSAKRLALSFEGVGWTLSQTTTLFLRLHKPPDPFWLPHKPPGLQLCVCVCVNEILTFKDAQHFSASSLRQCQTDTSKTDEPSRLRILPASKQIFVKTRPEITAWLPLFSFFLPSCFIRPR